jgi:hypothetical protein
MTAFFLEILKYILFIYINYFSLYELIYGALSMLLLIPKSALVQSQTMWKTPKPLLNPSHFLPLNVLEPILRCSLF